MAAHDFDTQLLPGMASVTLIKALERVDTLAHEMRESEALCALVHSHLVSLRAALHSVHALLDADTFAKLVAQFGVVISLAIALFKKLAEKKVLQRVAASRAVREGVQRIHTKIDEVFVAARLGNAPEMIAWRNDEDAAIEDQRVRLIDLIANPIALVQGLSASQVEEALTELQLEITRRPNPRAFRELMQTAIGVVASHIGAEVPVPENIPNWYVSRDDVEIGEQIDMGSFGAVHRAKWGSMRTDVCAKLLFTEGADAQDKFLAETRVWHRLAHPHVIPMLGGCHVGTPLFFISELATQGNLADFLEESPANKHQLWRLFYEAAQGLKYLHSECIVHADIKCNNVLIGNDNKAKLCDFGFAHTRTLSVGKSLKEQPNSARWKAPECVLGYGPEANPSFASDVFSLGMSIIEAKTGNVPWNMVADELIIDEIASGNGHPRPADGFTDAEWKLVAGMTAFEVADRLTLAQAIEMMGELAREEARLHGNGDDIEMDVADEVMCMSCGKKSPSSSKFCSECGTKFATTQ